MKKSEKIQLIYLIIYLALLIAELILNVIFPGIIMLATFGLTLLIGFLGMHLVRSLTITYTCPKCQHKFKINMFKDTFSSKNIKGEKLVVCPSCHEKNYIPGELN